MLRDVKSALLMLVFFTLLTGVVYPLAITGLAQWVFPHQANGSLIERDGVPVASELIGQSFDDPRYFWGRPSATSPQAYDAANSSGSNLGPTNPALVDAVRQRAERLRAADPGNNAPVPVDLVTASGSGLDPDISPAAAQYQAARVARARNLELPAVQQLIARHTQPRTLGVLGEPRLNVVQLNIALEKLQAQRP